MRYPRRSGEVTGSTSDGSWLVYVPSTSEVHVLNETARAIWELCDGETSLAEMAAAISEVTGIARELADAEVNRVIGEFAKSGLVMS